MDIYKKLEEITLAEIREAALEYAKQFGLESTPELCTVTPIRKKLTRQEIWAITPLIALPISKWHVSIRPLPTSRNQQRALVPVAYLSGAVAAMDYRPYKNP